MKDSNNVSSSGDSRSTSPSLLNGLRSRDPEAWNRLARSYGPLVYRWCVRAGLQAADAEDVVQEVFRTVALKIDGFRRERVGDTFRGWLWTITRNKLGDHLRRRRAEPQAVGGSSALDRLREIPAQEFEEATTTGSDDVGRLYRRVLDLIQSEFEQRTWQAFLRVAVDGQRPADVAAELGMTANAVYIAKARILRRVREELADE